MSDIEFDLAGAVGVLRRLASENSDCAQAHRSRTPALPAYSAGRDFVGHALRIQEALRQVHERAGFRWDNLAATARAAATQLQAVGDLDAAVGEALAKVDGQ